MTEKKPKPEALQKLQESISNVKVLPESGTRRQAAEEAKESSYA